MVLLVCKKYDVVCVMIGFIIVEFYGNINIIFKEFCNFFKV